MKVTIKPDEEKKVSYFTFVVDWDAPDCQEQINKILSLTICAKEESVK